MSDTSKDNDTPQPQSAATASVDAPNVIVLPPEAIKEAAARGTALQVTIATAHSGPLPSPTTLREYNAVVPNLADTIVGEFKKEARHRRRTQLISQIGAIGIALASIVAGTWLGYHLNSAVAAIAVIGPVCGIVGTAQLLQALFRG